jgi:hypothetical protein
LWLDCDDTDLVAVRSTDHIGAIEHEGLAGSDTETGVGSSLTDADESLDKSPAEEPADSKQQSFSSFAREFSPGEVEQMLLRPPRNVNYSPVAHTDDATSASHHPDNIYNNATGFPHFMCAPWAFPNNHSFPPYGGYGAPRVFHTNTPSGASPPEDEYF